MLSPSPHMTRRRKGFAVGGMALSLLIAGCGQQEAALPALPASQVAAELKAPAAGQTPAQRALDVQAGTILPGDGKDGEAALAKQVGKLKGTPVVVNLWADYCAPCKKEMPLLQRAALKRRGKVAFLGVAEFSSRGRQEKYLTKVALPYPSILDTEGEVLRKSGVDGLPQTLIFDAQGKQANIKIGPYTSLVDLQAEIDRYAK